MSLPTELICQIIYEIIDTPAVFVFDIDVRDLPHTPDPQQSVHISFRPFVSPPPRFQFERGQWVSEYPGTLESQVSRTIRSLLLTNRWIRAECLKRLQGIKVPTVSSNAVVRFNPRQHIVCLHDIGFSGPQAYRHPSIVPGDLMSWLKHESDVPTDLDFHIDHLAFVGMARDTRWSGRTTNLTSFLFLRTTFPSLQHIHRSIPDLPRKDPAEPVVLARRRRALSSTQNLGPAGLYHDRQFCRDLERMLSGGFITDYMNSLDIEWP